MPIPGFQDIMLPLLKLASDQKEHKVADAVEELAVRFELTPEERKELLPSGGQRRFDNRVWFARSDLTRAGLLESPGSGMFRISERGLGVLKQQPKVINRSFLKQFPEFSKLSGKQDVSEPGEVSGTQATPEELLESSHQELRGQLALEVLAHVKGCSPSRFEQIVVDLLVAMGYGGSRQDAGQAIGGVHDGGIDGLIKEDKLGLDVICIQAKRWDTTTVGGPAVQAFAGSMMGRKARKGVFITTSQFTQDARKFAEGIETKIILIDGPTLAELMIDYGIGVSVLRSYSVKKVDTDYFVE